ncbi:MAG: hypothetical protein ACTH1D_05020 [Mycobacteriaceae bacterium]|uniref:hypothetical protein n=1 Tax=Corynebacterium sp. TaxID=1720 RepID=UPI003F96AE0D
MAADMNTGTDAVDTGEPEVTQEEIQAHLQKDVPGSSTQDVISLIFAAVMILATVFCFVFLI